MLRKSPLKKAFRWVAAPFTLRKKEKELEIKTPFIERFSKLRTRNKQLHGMVLRSRKLIQERRDIHQVLLQKHIPPVWVGVLHGLGMVSLSDAIILRAGEALERYEKNPGPFGVHLDGTMTGAGRKRGTNGIYRVYYNGKNVRMDFHWENGEEMGEFIKKYGDAMISALNPHAKPKPDLHMTLEGPERRNPGRFHLHFDTQLDLRYVKAAYGTLMRWAKLDNKIKEYSKAHKAKFYAAFGSFGMHEKLWEEK